MRSNDCTLDDSKIENSTDACFGGYDGIQVDLVFPDSIRGRMSIKELEDSAVSAYKVDRGGTAVIFATEGLDTIRKQIT